MICSPVKNYLIRNQAGLTTLYQAIEIQQRAFLRIYAHTSNPALIKCHSGDYNRNVSKSFRKAVLYAFVGVFLILGAGTILYAQGYRLDFKTFSIKKVGAIYVFSRPKNPGIFLDGKQREETGGLLNSGVLIPNLFPKDYKIELKLEGYENWERKVSVKPSLVAELNPILLPKERAIVSDNAPESMLAFPDGLLITKVNGKIYANKTLIPGINIVDSSVTTNRLLTVDTKGTYYLTRLAGANKISTQKLPAAKAYILDSDTDQLISYSSSQISILEVGSAPSKIFTADKGKTIEQISPSRGLIAWSMFDPKHGTSTVATYDKFLNRISESNISLPGKTISMNLSARNILGLLESNGELYLYDIQNNLLEKRGADVRGLAFSPSGNWTAILSQKNLEIFSKDDDYTRLNLAAYQEIDSISWYRDESHLILKLRGSTGLLDFTAIEPENIQRLVASANIAYDIDGNVLYYEEGGRARSMVMPK